MVVIIAIFDFEWFHTNRFVFGVLRRNKIKKSNRISQSNSNLNLAWPMTWQALLNPMNSF